MDTISIFHSLTGILTLGTKFRKNLWYFSLLLLSLFWCGVEIKKKWYWKTNNRINTYICEKGKKNRTRIWPYDQEWCQTRQGEDSFLKELVTLEIMLIALLICLYQFTNAGIMHWQECFYFSLLSLILINLDTYNLNQRFFRWIDFMISNL